MRSEAWRSASRVVQAVEGWLRDGKPLGTVLQDHQIEMPKLNKGETITDGIERLRRRGRELRADHHRIQSAPYPSSYAKQLMREQIEALAVQGAPSVADLVEHGRQIAFQTQRVQSSVYNTSSPAVAFAEIEAAVPLLLWLHKDAMIAALEITAEADDPAALTPTEREKRESEVLDDLLSVEHAECELVWLAQSQNLPCEHRPDVDPRALLSVRCVVAPPVNPNGRAVAPQMPAEPDGSPLGLAEQLLEPPLAREQRPSAQVFAVLLDQVEGVQHRLMAPVLAPQCMEVRRAVVAGDHGLAVDQERRCLDAAGSVSDGREAIGPVVAAAREAADPRAVPTHHQPVAVMFDLVNP